MVMSRSNMLSRLRTEEFDVLVIGGGITGAGIAQDSAHRGLRTAVVEKGDFSSGTSHASTKLLHGGLRYLEQFEFRLMYEALHERNRLTRLAPHVAHWLPFIIPIYGRGWKMERIGYGLWLYDLLAGFPKGHNHRRISREEALRVVPSLKPDGLRGAYLYYDARTDDTRLTMDVMQSAAAGGAAIANYCKVTGLVKQDRRVTGASVHDEVSGDTFAVRAKAVVNATGVWADKVVALDTAGEPRRLRPSKGVHLIVPASRLQSSGAVLAPSPSEDGRFIFVVPWHGAILLGTTDTPYEQDPDLVATDEDDIKYILDAANATFPGVRLQRSDVVSTIAGLRPLMNAGGDTTAGLSREHKLWESESGLISIAGGKLTTYRTMAAEATDHVLKRLGVQGRRCRTAELPLGADRGAALERLVREDPELGKPIVPGLPNLKAEVAYAAREELAVYPEDFLERRTRLALLDRGHGEAQRTEVAALLARYGDLVTG